MNQMKNNRVKTDFIVKKQLLEIFRAAAFSFDDFIALKRHAIGSCRNGKEKQHFRVGSAVGIICINYLLEN